MKVYGLGGSVTRNGKMSPGVWLGTFTDEESAQRAADWIAELTGLPPVADWYRSHDGKMAGHAAFYRGSLMFGLLQLGLRRLHCKVDGNFLGLPVAVRQQVNMEYDWPFSLTAKQRHKR